MAFLRCCLETDTLCTQLPARCYCPGVNLQRWPNFFQLKSSHRSLSSATFTRSLAVAYSSSHQLPRVQVMPAEWENQALVRWSKQPGEPNEKWLRSFWAFAAKEIDEKDQAHFLSQFSQWPLVPVTVNKVSFLVCCSMAPWVLRLPMMGDGSKKHAPLSQHQKNIRKLLSTAGFGGEGDVLQPSAAAGGALSDVPYEQTYCPPLYPAVYCEKVTMWHTWVAV